MTRLLILPLLLAFTLLFAQQGAVTHSITHVLAEQSQDQSSPHEQHCDLCATYAQIGSALSSTVQHFDGLTTAVVATSIASVECNSRACTVFAARAPPGIA